LKVSFCRHERLRAKRRGIEFGSCVDEGKRRIFSRAEKEEKSRKKKTDGGRERGDERSVS